MKRFIALFLVLSTTSCLTDEGTVLRPSVFRKIVTTDGQVTVAGGRTATPMKVSVLAEDGSGVVRIGIRWTVESGPAGAVLADSFALTDGLGTAQNTLTTGPTEGDYVIRAALDQDDTKAVTFRVTALTAPVVTGLNPVSFSTGDTITVSGTDFTQSTGFLMGGKAAEVIGISVLGFGASIVVPDCLPDDSVAVSAVLLGVPSNTVSGRHSPVAGTLNLNPGEYVSVSPAEVSGCAGLPAAGASGAEYAVVVQSVADDSGGVSYTLSTGSAPITTTSRPVVSESYADAFHRGLREYEWILAGERDPNAVEKQPVLPAAPVLEGQMREFAVCETFPCRTTDDFVDIRAEAVYVGQHAAIYVDDATPAGGLTEGDLDALGAVFDEQLYEVATRAFGAESDVDDNGRVVILMTPKVNGLTPTEQCAQSFVTGFFLAVDIDPAFARDPRSNQGEVFYSFVPDPAGTVTCEHDVDRVRSTVPVTFVHEFQHMINYYQHVVLRGGTGEVLWLNEALSHFAEELAGHQFRALGDNAAFTQYVVGNLLNAYNYLRDPAGVAVLNTDGSGSLTERGAGWLFLRWLVDVHGNDVVRRLTESSLSGVPNVEAAVQRPMSALLPDWFLANWANELVPDSVLAPRLTYTTWQFRTTYQSLHDQAAATFDVPFPIVPDTIPSTTPVSLGSTVAAGSGDYYVVIQQPNDPALYFSLTEDGTAPLPSRGEPRLTILRTR